MWCQGPKDLIIIKPWVVQSDEKGDLVYRYLTNTKKQYPKKKIPKELIYMVKGIETTYTDFTRKTARYPKRREKEYLMLGLMNEAGEVGGAFKKEIRDHIDNTELIIDEMGDVLWYLNTSL